MWGNELLPVFVFYDNEWGCYSGVFVITAYDLKSKPLTACRRRHRRKTKWKRLLFLQVGTTR
jgi:hypothetical protein